MVVAARSGKSVEGRQFIFVLISQKGFEWVFNKPGLRFSREYFLKIEIGTFHTVGEIIKESDRQHHWSFQAHNAVANIANS